MEIEAEGTVVGEEKVGNNTCIAVGVGGITGT
jgi:hypothetical protein